MVHEYEPDDWGARESHLWDDISENYGGMGDDSRAMALFDAGWLDSNISSADRAAIRDEFFDYAIEEGYFDDADDFDWEAWREYMGY